jgi:hypothetical protein
MQVARTLNPLNPTQKRAPVREGRALDIELTGRMVTLLLEPKKLEF